MKVSTTIALVGLMIWSAVVLINPIQAQDAVVPVGNPRIIFEPDSAWELVCENGAKLVVVTDGASEGYGRCIEAK